MPECRHRGKGSHMRAERNHTITSCEEPSDHIVITGRPGLGYMAYLRLTGGHAVGERSFRSRGKTPAVTARPLGVTAPNGRVGHSTYAPTDRLPAPRGPVRRGATPDTGPGGAPLRRAAGKE